jgi:hypothetical protein
VCDENLAWRARRGRILWAHEVHIGTMSLVPLLQSKNGGSLSPGQECAKGTDSPPAEPPVPRLFSLGRFLSGRVDATRMADSHSDLTPGGNSRALPALSDDGLEHEDPTDRMGTVGITWSHGCSHRRRVLLSHLSFLSLGRPARRLAAPLLPRPVLRKAIPVRGVGATSLRTVTV